MLSNSCRSRESRLREASYAPGSGSTKESAIPAHSDRSGGPCETPLCCLLSNHMYDPGQQRLLVLYGGCLALEGSMRKTLDCKNTARGAKPTTGTEPRCPHCHASRCLASYGPLRCCRRLVLVTARSCHEKCMAPYSSTSHSLVSALGDRLPSMVHPATVPMRIATDLVGVS